MKNIYFNQILKLFSFFLPRTKSYRQIFGQDRPLPSPVQFSSYFIGIPHFLLLLAVIFSASGLSAQNNPNFYLADNGVTCMCPDAAVGETGTLTINGNAITLTKRIKWQITMENAASTCTSGITDMSDLFDNNAKTFN